MSMGVRDVGVFFLSAVGGRPSTVRHQCWTRRQKGSYSIIRNNEYPVGLVDKRTTPNAATAALSLLASYSRVERTPRVTKGPGQYRYTCRVAKPGGSRFAITMKMNVFLLLAICCASSVYALLGGRAAKCEAPCVPGDESIMRPKKHGTSDKPSQTDLRWQCSSVIADRICNFNRRYAEHSGYWEDEATFLHEESADTAPITFYDSNRGKPLFRAPGPSRTWDDFVEESRKHGWPSFRDEDGETVSIFGTHLGHNLPDAKGNRFCINLVSIAGRPLGKGAELL